MLNDFLARLDKKILLTRVLPVLAVLLVLLGIFVFTSGDKPAAEEPKKQQEQKEEEKIVELPAMTNMNTEASAEEVCRILRDAGLPNVDTFKSWVLDFGASAGENAGLCADWTAPGSTEIDLYECMHGWDSKHDYSDSDCRMTAYLLMKGVITAEYPSTYYNGTYLMFDIDAMEGTHQYDLIKEDSDLFNTIFGENYMSWGEEIKDTYARIWEEKGLKVNSDRASLLCVSILDETSREVFVGHTGILVKIDEGYLFVEKLAFQQPYQATKVKDMDQLLAMLSSRAEYFGQEGTEGEKPAVFVNGEYVGKLKQPK